MSIQPNIRKFGLMGTTALTRPASALGALALALGSGGAHAMDANTLPTGGVVTGGAATISQSGARMDVNQSSNRTVIDWRSFDVGQNAHVNFDQPTSGSIAVNRINASTNPTQINGRLTANGNVWVLNPNGVMFGTTSRVDVSGLVASTGNINVGQFMSGSNRIDFSEAQGGSVINEGQITVREGGLAAFVAPHVRNDGVIRAKLGKVTLAAGETFTLDLAGDQLVEIGLGSDGAIVEQLGQVIAEGGVIDISAKAAGEVVDSILNLDGYTSVASASVDGGDIVLSGGLITTTASAVFNADGGDAGDGGSIVAYADGHGDYAGQFSARGGDNGGDGGFVETSGKAVSLDAGLRVDTSAANGASGTWLIDPVDLVVGAGEAASIVTNLDSGSVVVQAENSITVNSAIDSSAQGNSNQLALNDENADNNLTINLNAGIALGANQTLTGEGTVVNVSNAATIQSGVDVASAAGAQVNVADGTYVENVRIDKSNLTLVSQNGRDVTTIQGISSVGALGAVQIDSGSDNFTLGSTGNGFTVIGIDNGVPGVENAAVYFDGANNGSTVQGNRITANGDAGLMSEYNAAVVGLTVDGNIFDGQAFTGLNPAGDGFGNQFTLANVPRQLVVISGGAGVTNTQNITFTNNQVTGSAGGLNGSGDEQGNTLVTIDAVGATITGNTFAGTTSRYGNQLRARGSNTVIAGNTFDNANLTTTTSPLYVRDATFSGNAANIDSFAELMAANNWQNGAAWTDNAVGGYYYVVKSVQGAVDMALSGGVVNLLDGVYSLTDTLGITKNISIVGDITNGKPTIAAGADFTGNNAADAMILVNDGVTFGLSDVAIDGTGHAVWQALRSHGNTTVTNVDFSNIAGSASGSPYRGIAIEQFGGTVAGGAGSDTHGGGLSAGHLTVTGSTFSNIGRIGVLVKGTQATADISGNTFTGKGTGDFLDYGIEVGASGQATITGNTISGNRGVALSDGSGSAGILVTSYYGGASNATIENNIITDNSVAVYVGYNGSDVSSVTAEDNDLSGNDTGVVLTATTATADFAGNWWGSTDDATVAAYMGGDEAASVDFSPFLVSGTDTDGGTVGFQGDFSALAVTNEGGQTGATGRIQEGINLVDDGGTLNVRDGTYASSTTLGVHKSVTLAGESQSGTIIDQRGVSGNYGISVSADDVSLSDFTFYGPDGNTGTHYGIKVSPGGAPSSRLTNFAIENVTSRGAGRAELDLNGVNGATITNFTADGRRVADDTETAGAGIQLTDTANVTLTGVTTLGNAWGGVALYQANRSYDQQTANINIDASQNTFNEVNGVFAQDESATNDFGTLNLTGFSHIVENPDHRANGDEFTFFQETQQAAIDFAMLLANSASSYVEGWTGTDTNGIFTVGTSTGGDAMSINTAVGTATSGNTVNVLDGTYAEDVTVAQQLALNFGTVGIDGLTLNGVGTTLSGSLSSSVNGFAFNTPIGLSGDTSLTTTGAATIAAGNIDGTTAGGQALTVNAGGAVTLGSLGGTTRLGATSITGADTTLTGPNYNANSLTFGGPVTLTQALTTFDTTISGTQAGDITFAGDIFGTSNGGQSVSFIAGDGAGAKSTNGDVSLQNAGTEAVKLASMNVSGDDFSAATVWLADSYTSVLTGDQFFTDDTLNVGGSANSTVGGNATGPINSGGSVNVTAGGNINGNISGSNVTLSGQTVSGNVTASGSGTITASTVNTNLNGGTFVVNAGGGTVTGNPSGLDTGGSGTLKVNGQTVVGSSDANVNQLVVEGYALPQGATVTDTGEIILPQGLAIGLISPAAGEGEGSEPKVIFVRSVQRLGALLAEGYTAIVIDLSNGISDEEQELALAG